jgi:hypothetical protein
LSEELALDHSESRFASKKPCGTIAAHGQEWQQVQLKILDHIEHVERIEHIERSTPGLLVTPKKIEVRKPMLK